MGDKGVDFAGVVVNGLLEKTAYMRGGKKNLHFFIFLCLQVDPDFRKLPYSQLG